MDHARCPFEKVILGVYAGCGKAQRFFVAERMGVECTSDVALNNCLTLIKLVRQNARFALKVTDTAERLPFGKEMKIMAGGLAGLESVIHGQTEKQPGQPDIRDIHDLVQAAQAVFGSLTALPYPEIMKSVAAFQLRKRHAPGSEKGA
ncbi:MAG: hypothetical protein HY082_05380 [Gammaproteobacteria bacterium]|nr:hypothetical protein [Gammaproteobacteria bacterium]